MAFLPPYGLIKPILFQMDAEKAHGLALKSLDCAYACGLLGSPAQKNLTKTNHAPVRVMGLDFPNRVGLAAGLDKNGAHIDALAALGFGFLEIGTVTPRAQAGNPKPRLFRVPEAQGIINRMGFNNGGVDALLANVAAAKFRGILGINIGKNADTPIEKALDDYLIGLSKVYTAASYVAINISSPNTKNLRQLQNDDALDALLGALKAAQLRLADTHGRYVPMALKIAPDLDDSQVLSIADLLKHHQIDAVIATNTTLGREGVQGFTHGDEAGGLSGAPVRDKSTAVIRALAGHLNHSLPIIGVGGILSTEDAKDKLAAGASLVQVYSGLIYHGPAWVQGLVKAVG